jgi:hypothetical protein
MGDGQDGQAPAGQASWGTRLVGGLQVIGGGLEVALGVGGIVVPEPATTVGGIILVAHGTDTVIAGFRTLWYGEVQATLTQQGGTAAARALGASPETARRVGTGVDLAAGVGPSLAVGVSRRMAIAAAERSSATVAVAYLPRRALEMGHNAVGVRVGQTSAWVEFVGHPVGKVMRMPPRELGNGYIVTELAVSAPQASRAMAAQQALQALGRQRWGMLSPNCTTTALHVLREAGIVVPAWSRSPFLLQLGVRAGPEITMFGGAAAALAPAVPPFLAPPGRPAPVVVPRH